MNAELVLNIKLIALSILGSSISYFGLIVFPSTKKGANSANGNSFEQRMTNWAKILKMDRRVVAFDIFFACVIISFAYTMIVLEVTTARQALLGGLTAEAFFYHYIHNARNGNGKFE